MDEAQEKRYAKGKKHMVTVLVSEIYKINSIQITMEKLLGKRPAEEDEQAEEKIDEDMAVQDDLREENTELDKQLKILLLHYRPDNKHTLRLVLTGEDGEQKLYTYEEMQDMILEYEKELMELYPGQVQRIDMQDTPKWQALNQVIDGLDTDYFQILQAGDRISQETLTKSEEYMDEVGEGADILLMNLYNSKKLIRGVKPKALKGVYSLDYIDWFRKNEWTFTDCLVRRSAWEDIHFNEEGGYGYAPYAITMLELANRKRNLAMYRGAYKKFGYVNTAGRPKKEIPEEETKEFYTEELGKNYLPALQWVMKRDQEIPRDVQYYIFGELCRRFKHNRDSKDKKLLQGEKLQEFKEVCKNILKYIDDDIIWGYTGSAKKYTPGNALAYALFQIKYGEDLNMEFGLQKRERVSVQSRMNGRLLPNELIPTIHVDLMNYEKKTLSIEFSAPKFAGPEGVEVKALINDKEYPIQETPRYSYVRFFSENVYKLFTFIIEIPYEQLQERNVLSFKLKQNGNELMLPVISGRYVSRINSTVPGSYWCFGEYMVRFAGKIKHNAIIIEKAGRKKRIIQELRVLKNMWSGKTKNRAALKLRLLYWLTRPYYKNKNIWIAFDKLYKGGDCGEYFYKYMCSRKDSNAYPVYIINEDAPDRQRLIEEGYHPVSRRTWKQKLLFLNSKMIFATHVPIPGFNAIAKNVLKGIQDRLEYSPTCIQHGLTVQYLAHDSHRQFNNNKRYYCASKYEIQNLSLPEYDYSPEHLKLTGVPRYDGLVNKDQRQILITPTWRSYIAMPSVMGKSRPYNPNFKETDYFRIYNDLIHDEKLIETAKRTGYKLIYLLHPITSAQLEDYGEVENVELIQATTVNYEKILCESSLMVTDYSGVQFDFAYMRKPVVYYHPPKLPPHYVEGGFFYDTQGFGEICTEHKQLVDTICDYMEHECKLKDYYKARQDDFFAYSDHDNCKRIFEDAIAYQKELAENR